MSARMLKKCSVINKYFKGLFCTNTFYFALMCTMFKNNNLFHIVSISFILHLILEASKLFDIFELFFF